MMSTAGLVGVLHRRNETTDSGLYLRNQPIDVLFGVENLGLHPAVRDIGPGQKQGTEGTREGSDGFGRGHRARSELGRTFDHAPDVQIEGAAHPPHRVFPLCKGVLAGHR